MCNPALAVMAIGTAMQYQGQRSATQRQEKQLGLMQDRNDGYTQQAIDVADKNMQQYAPQTRADNLKERNTSAEKSLVDALTQSQDNGQGDYADTTQGRVSDLYNTERANRVAGDTEKALNIAKVMARFRAPYDLRTQEGFANANAASDASRIGFNQRAMGQAGAIDAGAAGIPNAGLMLAGGMVQGYGSGMSNSSTKTKPVTNTVSKSRYQYRSNPNVPRSLFRGR